MRLDGDRLRSECDRLKGDKASVEETLSEAQQSLMLLREENESLSERVKRAEVENQEGRAIAQELNREVGKKKHLRLLGSTM